MKHTLFACLLLGVMLAFCIVSSVAVRAETQAVNDAIASSRNAASRDDFQSAADSLQAAKETWAAHERFFGVVLAHEELDEVNIAFAELLQYASLADKDDFLAGSARLVATIEHIREMEVPSYHNLL